MNRLEQLNPNPMPYFLGCFGTRAELRRPANLTRCHSVGLVTTVMALQGNNGTFRLLMYQFLVVFPCRWTPAVFWARFPATRRWPSPRRWSLRS